MLRDFYHCRTGKATRGGVNESQSDFCLQTLKINTLLQLIWSKCSNHKHISERMISWLQNVPNTHMSQQNKWIANRTPKSSKRSNIVSSTSVVFSSTKFCSWVQNWTKRTPIDMKFYKNLSKYLCKISLNFELNPTCESPADLKLQPEIGVLLGFSRTRSNWVFLKPRPKSATTRCMQWSEEGNSPPINPKPNHLKRIKGFPPKTQEGEKGRTSNQNNSKFQQVCKTEMEM